jgi:hypothetical protein
VQARFYVNIESRQTVQAQVKNDWWRPGSNWHQIPMKEGVSGSAKTVITTIIKIIITPYRHFNFTSNVPPPIQAESTEKSQLS